MTNKEYDKAKEECWKAVKKEFDQHYWGEPPLDIVSFTFDRAYALGKQETSFFQNGNTHYSGNHFADVSNMVNTRLNIATNVLSAIIQQTSPSLSRFYLSRSAIKEMTKASIQFADALIAECEKGGDNE